MRLLVRFEIISTVKIWEPLCQTIAEVQCAYLIYKPQSPNVVVSSENQTPHSGHGLQNYLAKRKTTRQKYYDILIDWF